MKAQEQSVEGWMIIVIVFMILTAAGVTQSKFDAFENRIKKLEDAQHGEK